MVGFLTYLLKGFGYFIDGLGCRFRGHKNVQIIETYQTIIQVNLRGNRIKNIFAAKTPFLTRKVRGKLRCPQCGSVFVGTHTFIDKGQPFIL
jgi:hypothetical protein